MDEMRRHDDLFPVNPWSSYFSSATTSELTGLEKMAKPIRQSHLIFRLRAKEFASRTFAIEDLIDRNLSSTIFFISSLCFPFESILFKQDLHWKPPQYYGLHHISTSISTAKARNSITATGNGDLLVLQRTHEQNESLFE